MTPLTLDEVYALIPGIACKGHCAPSCGVAIPAELGEARRLGVPHSTVLDERSGGVIAILDSDRKGRCVALRNGRCTRYDVRPTICRLWGVAEGMPCTWGCEPERMLSREEAREILVLAREAAKAVGSEP